MNPGFMLFLQDGIRWIFLSVSGIIFRLVDSFLLLAGRLFREIEERISFTFIGAVCGSIGAWLGAVYLFFFAGINIKGWVLEDIYYEFITFLIATIIASTVTFIYFGFFHKIGFSGMHESIREMNMIFDGDYYKNLSRKDDNYLLTLLDSVMFLPVHAVLVTLIWTFVIAAAIGAVFFYRNSADAPLRNYLIIFFGAAGAELVLAGVTYILTDYFTGSKRIDIKRILQSRGIACNIQHGLFMLREKFMIIFLGVVFSFVTLAVNIYIGQMTIYQTIAFLAMVSFGVGFLLFLYLDAICKSLDQVRDAANDLAQGGRGSLPMIATEHEFIDFASSFEKATGEVYTIRKNLQGKVEEKTLELKKSLDEVNRLKQQQDGDYLLTSFLLAPLAQNTVTGDKVKVDFLIRQKKKFQFRKWDKEVGGDICIAHIIILDGRRYIVFLNADAMGKSMQGAGGALVLGAAFQSIIERTRFVNVMQSRFPERWLKNSFIELHRLFQTFESRMLVSMFFGLIDEETGLLYYINAEHPRSVIFRNNSAGYIEKSKLYMLGSPQAAARIHISTYQLMPGDVLIAASDGRDDIQLGIGHDGSRIIDSDETRFLMAVEQGESELTKIFDYLVKLGELTDDLSMIRIKYEENVTRRKELEMTPEACDLWRKARKAYSESKIDAAIELIEKAMAIQENSVIIIKDVILFYYKAKNYEKAVQYAEKYMKIEDGDSDILYILSICYKKVSNYDRAMALAVKLRLRMPDMVQNLLHLSELNVLMGSPERIKRAQEYCSEALELEPQNEIARKIEEHIKTLQTDD